MKAKVGSVVGAVAALAACGQQAEAPQAQPTEISNDSIAIANQGSGQAPSTTATAEKPTTSLPEPKGPIDPKSVEAAGQVVQNFGALIEQKRWTEANRLWGNASLAAKFQSQLNANRENHLEVGNLGEPEGAAGSIYVTMPVIFYGDQADGQPFRRPADVILRRVNDVPGSTDAQRRWHIERIDWAG